MKRIDIIKELSRENKTRRRIFPQWIQAGRLHKSIADKRLECTVLAEAVLTVMTDDEFTNLVQRLEIQPSHEQGKLF